MPALTAELASTLLVEAAARFILDVTFALCTHDHTRALFTAVLFCVVELLSLCVCALIAVLLCCCAAVLLCCCASSAAVYCVVVTAGAPEGQLCACKL